MVSLETIEGKEDEPIVCKTRLGWIVQSPTYESFKCSNGRQTFSMNMCVCQSGENELHQLVKNYFSIEHLGIKIPENSLESIVGRFNNDRGRRGARCFVCNEYGHIAVQCRKQRQEDKYDTTHRSTPSNTIRQEAVSRYATGLFAGFVGQGNVNGSFDTPMPQLQCMIDCNKRQLAIKLRATTIMIRSNMFTSTTHLHFHQIRI